MRPTTPRNIACCTILALALWTTDARADLLANPDFDTDLTGWSLNETAEAQISWNDKDADARADSGSMHARNVSDLDFRAVPMASQCVEVMPGETYTFGGSVFAPPAQTYRGAFFRLHVFGLPGCGGGAIDTTAVNTGSSVTDAWVPVSREVTAPAGAVSARLQFVVSRASGAPADDVEVFVDEVFLIEGDASGCADDPHTACIGDRFAITVDYETVQGGGASGQGVAVPLDSLGIDRGAIFWFFGADNPELLIKVLDPCTFASHFWVFYSAGTNVGFEVTIVDTATDAVWMSSNPDQHPAPPVQDTAAFPCAG